MYLAGLLMATGASLALAGPASAAPSHHRHHHYDCYRGWDNDWFWYQNNCDSNDGRDYYEHNSQNNGSHYNGIVLLSGNSNNGDRGGLLGGLL
jgi:hypothetical protein